MTENKYADRIGAALLDQNDGLQEHRRSPVSNGIAFMCLKYGQEEAAKHTVPDGQYVKVACVRKSVPRIIE